MWKCLNWCNNIIMKTWDNGDAEQWNCRNLSIWRWMDLRNFLAWPVRRSLRIEIVTVINLPNEWKIGLRAFSSFSAALPLDAYRGSRSLIYFQIDIYYKYQVSVGILLPFFLIVHVLFWRNILHAAKFIFKTVFIMLFL